MLLSAQRHQGRTGQVWKGKSLLVDFDGTLADCRRTEDGLGYSLERVREGAREALGAVRERDARCFITSAACDGYIRDMARAAGLLDLFERTFDCDDLRVMLHEAGGRWEYSAKSYENVMYHISEADPTANCAIIGNDPGLDVPRSPQGIVTVLAGMDSRIGSILDYLETLLVVGCGSFARGFDRASLHPSIVAGGSQVTMLRLDSWHFTHIGQGQARVALFGMGREQVMFHLP